MFIIGACLLEGTGRVWCSRNATKSSITFGHLKKSNLNGPKMIIILNKTSAIFFSLTLFPSRYDEINVSPLIRKFQLSAKIYRTLIIPYYKRYRYKRYRYKRYRLQKVSATKGTGNKRYRQQKVSITKGIDFKRYRQQKVSITKGIDYKRYCYKRYRLQKVSITKDIDYKRYRQ